MLRPLYCIYVVYEPYLFEHLNLVLVIVFNYSVSQFIGQQVFFFDGLKANNYNNNIIIFAIFKIVNNINII